jgi:hypothetical protein
MSTARVCITPGAPGLECRRPRLTARGLLRQRCYDDQSEPEVEVGKVGRGLTS